MAKRNVCWGSALLVALLMLVPFTASAQQGSGIAGEVTDDTGGVMPGVTVEATSPALIERVRTAFSDGEGRYNIINLVPGTYSVTFTLPGFSTIVREGVVLTAGFTANIDAAMQVGGIEETITVTGASPLVDVQNTVAQTSVTTELLKSLPTGAGFTAQSLITLVPGVTGTADVGGSSGIYRGNGQSGGLFFHGKSDVSVQYDGMGTAAPTGTAIPYVLNKRFASETVLETGGGNAESEATLVMNLIPQEGGNQFSFGAFGTYTNDSLQSDNLTDELKAQGVTHTNEQLKFYNADITVGGPIKQDKVWFFAAGRAARNINTVPGVFFNAGQGTPHYVPDLDRPAYRTEWMRSGGGRITWQASQRNKIGVFTDFQTFFNRGRGNLPRQRRIGSNSTSRQRRCIRPPGPRRCPTGFWSKAACRTCGAGGPTRLRERRSLRQIRTTSAPLRRRPVFDTARGRATQMSPTSTASPSGPLCLTSPGPMRSRQGF